MIHTQPSKLEYVLEYVQGGGAEVPKALRARAVHRSGNEFIFINSHWRPYSEAILTSLLPPLGHDP